MCVRAPPNPKIGAQLVHKAVTVVAKRLWTRPSCGIGHKPGIFVRTGARPVMVLRVLPPL